MAPRSRSARSPCSGSPRCAEASDRRRDRRQPSEWGFSRHAGTVAGNGGPAIVHIEFKSSDFARTSAFTPSCSTGEPEQNASGSYMKLDSADGPSAGWVRADLVQSAGPVTYLSVDDLASKLDEVEEAGGRVLVRSLPFAGGGEVGAVRRSRRQRARPVAAQERRGRRRRRRSRPPRRPAPARRPRRRPPSPRAKPKKKK